jgi:predicted O-linked N-acetylglucosamine transferase (SPINDLY family)
MRGRQTLGMLTTLGLTELVASDAERYIALAVEIARDPGRQHKLRERIASTRGHLFHDRAAIDAMQDFYLSLSAGDVAPWRPNAV